jgi:exodeoxyribonuclease VII large subunit
VREWAQRLDDIWEELRRCSRQQWRDSAVALQNVAGRLARLQPARILERRRESLRQAEARLRLLGPEQVLARGYSITTDAKSGRIIRRVKEVKAGQALRTRVKDGEIRSITAA